MDTNFDPKIPGINTCIVLFSVCYPYLLLCDCFDILAPITSAYLLNVIW